jgi:hypothetical protein
VSRTLHPAVVSGPSPAGLSVLRAAAGVAPFLDKKGLVVDLS